jgi:hypothetical protein
MDTCSPREAFWQIVPSGSIIGRHQFRRTLYHGQKPVDWSQRAKSPNCKSDRLFSADALSENKIESIV